MTNWAIIEYINILLQKRWRVADGMVESISVELENDRFENIHLPFVITLKWD